MKFGFGNSGSFELGGARRRDRRIGRQRIGLAFKHLNGSEENDFEAKRSRNLCGNRRRMLGLRRGGHAHRNVGPRSRRPISPSRIFVSVPRRNGRYLCDRRSSNMISFWLFARWLPRARRLRGRNRAPRHGSPRPKQVFQHWCSNSSCARILRGSCTRTSGSCREMAGWCPCGGWREGACQTWPPPAPITLRRR